MPDALQPHCLLIEEHPLGYEQVSVIPADYGVPYTEDQAQKGRRSRRQQLHPDLAILTPEAILRLVGSVIKVEPRP
jgi:hypothetical protein